MSNSPHSVSFTTSSDRNVFMRLPQMRSVASHAFLSSSVSSLPYFPRPSSSLITTTSAGAAQQPGSRFPVVTCHLVQLLHPSREGRPFSPRLAFRYRSCTASAYSLMLLLLMPSLGNIIYEATIPHFGNLNYESIPTLDNLMQRAYHCWEPRLKRDDDRSTKN